MGGVQLCSSGALNKNNLISGVCDMLLENGLTEEQNDKLELATALALIKTLYKQGIINENTYNNIKRKYPSYLQK